MITDIRKIMEARTGRIKLRHHSDWADHHHSGGGFRTLLLAIGHFTLVENDRMIFESKVAEPIMRKSVLDFALAIVGLEKVSRSIDGRL